MEGNRQPSFKKRPNSQFKKNRSFKKGKWNNSTLEQSSGNLHASDTVYRILCHSRKIGSVIGKGGNIVKALREETQSKITVAESVPGSDERVVMIYSPPTKIPRKQNTDTNDKDLATEGEDNLMEPHCAAQDALLKVHDRIIEEDLLGGAHNEDDNVIITRLLVPKIMVGCLLGRKGDVIQRVRNETGASIRVLPAEQLPPCAMSTDELVQISGNPAVAKRALYEVSTILHQNPRKDKTPSNVTIPYGAHGFHPLGPTMENMPPPGKLMWSQRNPSSHGPPPMPWMGGYDNEPSGFGRSGLNSVPAPHGGEAPSEFSMKIMCSAAKIGGVIGKGGFIVKQLQQDTGASIHVEDESAESDERVIRVSCFEAPLNPKSQTIDAILQLQNKTSEISEDGSITTRLLVPSSKVGCLLGQGGHVINAMRRRTQADIRVSSKEDKPKCAAGDEELVQISGNYEVAREALAEVASRLRERCLRNAKSGVEPVPIGTVPGFGSRGAPSRSGAIGAGRSAGYEPFKGGGREYEPPSYPVPPSAAGYPNFNRAMEMNMPDNAIGSVMGTGQISTRDIGGTRVKLQDPRSGGSECVVEIRGSSQHLNNAHTILHSMSSSGQNNNPQQASNHNFNSQQASYPNFTASQSPYPNSNPQHVSNQIPNSSQQGAYPSFSASHTSYPNSNPQHASNQNFNAQQGAYPNFGASQTSYQNNNSQQGHPPYPNSNSQHDQTPYPNNNPPHGANQNLSSSQQGAHANVGYSQTPYPNSNPQQAQTPYPNSNPHQAPYSNYQNISTQQDQYSSHQTMSTQQTPYQNNSAQSSYNYPI